MIRSFRDSATRRFAEGGRSHFSGLDEALARRRLATLAQATALTDIGALRSVGLHKLKGDLADFWAVNVNGPWRIIFRYSDGHASDVQIIDYHA